MAKFILISPVIGPLPSIGTPNDHTTRAYILPSPTLMEAMVWVRFTTDPPLYFSGWTQTINHTNVILFQVRNDPWSPPSKFTNFPYWTLRIIHKLQRYHHPLVERYLLRLNEAWCFKPRLTVSLYCWYFSGCLLLPFVIDIRLGLPLKPNIAFPKKLFIDLFVKLS